ncbi:MAG: tRNA-intron lyase [Candidatus Woesearchaeota archaeon]|nr:tRNA-intron lyase [Candidatus Woesearchaeota archaeon]
MAAKRRKNREEAAEIKAIIDAEIKEGCKPLPPEKEEKREIPEAEEKAPKEKIRALFTGERVVTENSDASRELYNQSRFGAILDDGKVQLAFFEAMFLSEKGKIEIVDSNEKKIDKENFFKKVKRIDKNVWVRYSVFKDLRNRGYIVKTALKFGADFRVYDRGIKPGEDHAKWIVYPVHESGSSTWYEFAAKNRVAHSTKKRLLIGIVDDEGDVTYYEIKWIRP